MLASSDKPESAKDPGNRDGPNGNMANAGQSPHQADSSTQACKPFGLIDSTGICVSCEDADASTTALSCVFCCRLFHGVCRSASGDKNGASDTICVRTFYKSFTQATTDSAKSKSRPGNFLFSCDTCMTTFENKSVATQDTKVDVIDRRVDSLVSEFSEFKQVLDSIAVKLSTPAHAPGNTSSGYTPATYASTLSSNLKRSVLVVDIPDSEDDDQLLKAITENSIRVDTTYKNKNGKTVVVCPTEADRNNLSQHLSKVPAMKSYQPPDKVPTVSVANLPREFSPDELLDAIVMAQPTIQTLIDNGQIFSVLNVKSQRRNENLFQATVRMGNDIRTLISNQRDKLYIGSCSYRVFDHFHVKRCNKCQKYNHYEKECQADSHTCGLCAGNHSSSDCELSKKEKFTPSCCNCKGSAFDKEKDSHSAFSTTCPSYIAAQEKLKKSIHFYVAKN